MAATSPALSNSSPMATTPATASAASPTMPTTNSSRNLRGLNKPKCIQCGNVARSRCPYQSCKSCCAKAQNPCHIHVLKNNATFPDKAPSADCPLFDQKSTEASASGSSLRLASLRQLSSNFAQFNNLQSPLRSKKPLTRKDAALINEWRFQRLKQYKQHNIEVENEAFDRYMQNVCLLEEVFAVNSTLLRPSEDGSPRSSSDLTLDDNTETSDGGLTLMLRSDSVRTENFRKRLRDVVDDGLRKLWEFESNSDGNNSNEPEELVKKPIKGKSLRAERASAFNDLLDKLNKARNEEDLKSCLELKHQLFNHGRSGRLETEGTETSEPENDSSPGLQANYSASKWFCRNTIDQDDVNCVDVYFASLKSIGNL